MHRACLRASGLRHPARCKHNFDFKLYESLREQFRKGVANYEKSDAYKSYEYFPSQYVVAGFVCLWVVQFVLPHRQATLR